MRRAAYLALAAIFLLPLATIQGQDSLAPAVLKELKEATAFITVKGRGTSSSGSGFLLNKDARTGYVVTNSHVITMEEQVTPEVRVIFNSGDANEFVLTAEIIGDDPLRDLAVLRVTADKLPTPIKSDEVLEPFETMRVFVLGFPFGSGLAAKGKNPAITISPGSVSSIRKDSFGQIARIQIDGNINPGNSGGPVVTAKGTLLGVAVSKLEGTQIGFAIPAQDMRDMLQGRVRQLLIRRFEGTGKAVRLEFRGSVIDPLGKLTKISLHYVPQNKAPAYAIGKDGKWPPISAEAKSQELKLDKGEISGELDLGIPGTSAFLFQPSYVRGDGKHIYGAAAVVHVLSLPYAFPEPLAGRKAKEPAKKSQLDDDLTTPAPPELNTYAGLSNTQAFFRHTPGTVFPINHSAVQEERKFANVPGLVSKRLRIRGAKPIRFAAFTPGGERLFLATDQGSIRCYSVPTMIEQQRLELGTECIYLGLSREGLIARLSPSGHLAVIDPETLEIKRYLRAERWGLIACSPNSSLAYVTLSPGIYDTLLVVDLAQGRFAGKITTADVIAMQPRNEARFMGWYGLAVSPDDKYLLAKSTDVLHRFALENTTLAYEQSTRQSAGNDWSFSTDSKYLAIRSYLEHQDVSKRKEGVYIMPIDDLKRPTLSLPMKHTNGIVLDSSRRRLYGLVNEGLAVQSLDAGEPQTCILTTQNDRGEALFTHPHGAGLVAILSNTAHWIDLAAK